MKYVSKPTAGTGSRTDFSMRMNLNENDSITWITGSDIMSDVRDVQSHAFVEQDTECSETSVVKLF